MALSALTTATTTWTPYFSSSFQYLYILFALFAVFVLIDQLLIGALPLHKFSRGSDMLTTFFKFFYASFLKPHTGDGVLTGQQAALESFYKAQADVYDASRKLLLRGREDMLGLAAAQLKYKTEKGAFDKKKPIWVDVGGGTGYNIEAMQAYLDVPTFFAKVYLVDLSPSLLEVAKKRFDRLGWDVEIVCQNARTFRLESFEASNYLAIKGHTRLSTSDSKSKHPGADLVTLSYSLSMIPDYYSVVDSIPSLLSAGGILGVVDFYVQSIVEVSGRTYTGGSFNRHVTWLGRVFWRAWFDVDRVGLEGARRDYLEYRFGTLKSVDERNYLLGGIPYYGESNSIILLASSHTP
jgi:betaine lipid synthase